MHLLKLKLIIYFLALAYLPSLYAVDTIYCPTKHGYISVGMSMDQVVNACGEPATKARSSQPYKKNKPVMQLIYNNQGTAHAFYGVWSLPVGLTAGTTLKIEIVDNKVYSVHINGDASKALSVCKGTAIVQGDPVSLVYSACGNPSAVNDTYMEETVPSSENPMIWIYQIPYQNPIKLIFLNDRLQAINQ